MGRKEEPESHRSRLMGCFIQLAVIVGLLWFFVFSRIHPNTLTRTYLIESVSAASQICYWVEKLNQDNAQAHLQREAFPFDAGIKTGKDYVQYLIKECHIEHQDLSKFVKPGHSINGTLLEPITSENIGFRIANISKNDSPETIFLVTPNFATHSPYPFSDISHWWDFLKPFNSYGIGFAVILKNGKGRYFYRKRPEEIRSTEIGVLPPREPKFLAP